MCDACPASFHLECLDEPLLPEELPEGEWHCRACRCLWSRAVPSQAGRGIYTRAAELTNYTNSANFRLPQQLWSTSDPVRIMPYAMIAPLPHLHC